jgi:protein associated with RNAse G/E
MTVCGNELVFVGEFDADISHPELGLIKRGTLSYEYYWLDRWYNVFRFHEPSGELMFYYCNVNMPPTFDSTTLRYVDLDLDLIVRPDMSFSVLDRHEFNGNAVRLGYPEKVIAGAENALKDLINLVKAGALPKP